jgi:hypothetical protein
MKTLKLTQGYVALVDDEDYERASKFYWRASLDKRKDGTIKNVYARRRFKGGNHTQSLHHFILGIDSSKSKVDHEDNDGLNNQKTNLSTVTNQQNSMKQRKSPNNTSGFKGVSWDKGAKKWRAYIRVSYKLLYLGIFSDLFEAACAYDQAAVKHFGKFAACNFAVN